MPDLAPTEAPGDERAALLGYLAAQRRGIRRALTGLTEAQARSTPSASALSLAGVVKHCAWGERSWLRKMRGEPVDPQTSAQGWRESFTAQPDETVAVLLARYDEAARVTEAAVRAEPSLDRTFTCRPTDWDRGGERTWRWALLHLIEEAARHAGHADIVRESIDGASAFALESADGLAPHAT
jgi:uncharacterized damage-inducible protein DinB